MLKKPIKTNKTNNNLTTNRKQLRLYQQHPRKEGDGGGNYSHNIIKTPKTEDRRRLTNL